MPPVKPVLKPGSLLIVGEAPGEQEERLGTPFVGSSGELLNTMLVSAGGSRAAVSVTNVFDVRPPNNDLDAWGLPPPEARKDLESRRDESPEFLTPITGNRLVVHPDLTIAALKRLKQEISYVKPNCILALGNTALQALCGVRGIGKLRGALHNCLLYPAKVIPTYHPAAILRQYENLPIAVMDIRKALYEATFPEVRCFSRKINIIENLADLEHADRALRQADYITFDIETKARQITCVGLAGDKSEVFVLPFWARSSPSWSYWPSVESEVAAVKWLKSIFESPIPKVAQNGLYDIQYLLLYGIAVRNYTHDTMLLQHSLFPSLPKGLDFLGSIYCNERAWKQMRPRKKDISSKREE